MKNFRIKFFISIFVSLVFLGFGYFYREDVGRFLRGSLNRLQPCEKSITYTIASLDPRFSLTKEKLLEYTKQAEKIWESPINKQLFEYSPEGDLKINFIYDYRQKATDELKKMGIVINDDRATYDALKAKYDLLIVSYKKEKAKIETLIVDYNAKQSAFEKEINYWNGRGGVSKAEYNTLQEKKYYLDNQVIVINKAKNSLNELVDTINSAEIVLNKLITVLNLQVNKYNVAGSSIGKEFSEGEYISDPSGTTINVFQFDDHNQLLRVLAHEFGHALELEHIDNPKAIMYYLNEGINEKLTADDLAALKKRCGIK